MENRAGRYRDYRLKSYQGFVNEGRVVETRRAPAYEAKEGFGVHSRRLVTVARQIFAAAHRVRRKRGVIKLHCGKEGLQLGVQPLVRVQIETPGFAALFKCELLLLCVTRPFALYQPYRKSTF